MFGVDDEVTAFKLLEDAEGLGNGLRLAQAPHLGAEDLFVGHEDEGVLLKMESLREVSQSEGEPSRGEARAPRKVSDGSGELLGVKPVAGEQIAEAGLLGLAGPDEKDSAGGGDPLPKKLDQGLDHLGPGGGRQDLGSQDLVGLRVELERGTDGARGR